ncbi:MAG: hypothetical protein JRI41_03845 [Deltaproteobacteria bacterium]|nr:hypothetical protein [Deltaproteobacteria bacterium]RLB88321.1 MAG: hypothetical protein DRH10_07770 [Deltaproteobacteria bacterium]
MGRQGVLNTGGIAESPFLRALTFADGEKLDVAAGRHSSMATPTDIMFAIPLHRRYNACK